MVQVTLKCFTCLYEEEQSRDKGEDFSGLACPNCEGGLTDLNAGVEEDSDDDDEDDGTIEEEE